ncbi:uncharacterized protein PFL1_03699 [Pseudozyma flocculosa PF-1]|uniref:DUF7729 domain-containing protein n=2 Tax=Pseudozyma flocculosa TaxID=84751 RepID=A0A5C3F3Q9_9BASI|nr:uncharacterized protein PFL1_03699 [Pseudozyma flocculosa PF-1]EPQ28898.1 hypothetical protein PFL1_03699 [Pseudozyma flocculosa PF-1]SPO38615.1 uncharacterized protein PSFLO_04093 [Pseudozyma flocculosa]
MKFYSTVGAIALLGAGLVSAQDAASTSSASAASAIPTDLSDSCRTFLAGLNTDTKISACTGPLVAATKAYSAAATNTSNTNTAAEIDSTLINLCGANSCDADLIRSYLDSFWQSCHSDIQQRKPKIGDYYDNLYMITPLRNAICSTDSTGGYCLKTIAKAASSTSIVSKRSLVADADSGLLPLERRQSSNAQIDDLADSVAEETAAASITNTNTAFLYLSEKTPKSILCSDCSQNILAAYIEFETAIPYGIGLQNSDKLKVQSSIFQAYVNTCGRPAVTSLKKIAGVSALDGATRGQVAGMTVTAAAAAAVALVAFL